MVFELVGQMVHGETPANALYVSTEHFKHTVLGELNTPVYPGSQRQFETLVEPILPIVVA